MKRKRLSSILGIELTTDRLHAVELRARGESVAVARETNVPLSLNVFSAEAELMGREIRSRLDAAGIRARACVLCLSAENIMIQRVELTGVPEEDVDSLLSLEAERAFPFPPEEVVLSVSRDADEAGKPWATLAAVSSSHVAPVLAALRRAKLRIVSITPSVTSLVAVERERRDAALLVEDASLQLAVATHGSVLLLRSFHIGKDNGTSGGDDGGEDGPGFDDLQRDLRMTLRRLPRDFRKTLKQAHVFGSERLTAELRSIVEGELAGAEMPAAAAGVGENGEIREGESLQVFPGVTRAASRLLLGSRPMLEFWRPREVRWRLILRQWMAKGTLVRLGMAAAVIAVLLFGAFAFQIWRAASLERKWGAMNADVERLEMAKDALRDRRPWLTPGGDRLEILKSLAEAFPETGNVWARSVEIRESGRVECAGYARGTRNYLDVLQALRATAGVASLQVGQVKGGNPVQFSFQFTWKKDASDE